MEIKKLKNTDSLSESMNTINTNFEILSRIDEGDKQRWEKYINGLDGKVKTLIDAIDSKNIELSEQIEHIGDMFNKVPNMDDLQHQVSIAISDVNSELGNAIKNISAGAAGIQVENKMGDYAKTTYVNNALSNYTTSVAFEDYKSDSKNKTASANSIVANSKFYTTDDGYFVLLTGTKSGYKNLSEYYNDLETTDKDVIDPDGKGLSDPDVLNRFITHCEQKFKTVSTELAGFSTKVAEDMAELDILAQISKDNGKQISAAIITQANELGSSIKLNADHLNLTGDEFVVNTSNFKVNTSGNGNVEVTGAITATSLTIGSGSSGKTLNDYINTTWATKEELSTGLSNIESQLTDDTWLTGAFGQTDISNGVILTGNVLAADNSNKVTAGMLGGNASDTTANDLRFFAGSEFSNRQSASFRVYENGELWATNAHITGKIIATELEISPSSSAASTFSNLVESIGNNLYTTPDYLDSTLSTYVQTTTFGTTLSNYATKSFVSNAVASVSSYDDDWLMNAFNKTTISAGLVLTGNVVTMDASSNVTAGMMGGSTSGNDLRFFAGSSDVSIAPFRVYEDGSFYAEKAHLSGVIKYNFLRITQNNWENYKRKLGEKNGVPYYTINLNNTGKNVEIAYLPFVPGGIGLTFDVNTPTITEDMVGTEINIINLIPKSTITIGHNFRDFTVEGYPYTNAAIIKPDNSQSSGFVGGNSTGRVGFLECMTLMAIEIPTYEPEANYNICNDCGYNNGGLFTGGVCPDCGSTNIRTETRGGGTRFAWIRTDKYIT